MNIRSLITMANSIGDFFAAMPDREAALADIADHIRKFWEPRMRRPLVAFVDTHPDGRDGDVQLSEIVLAAVTAHLERLRPPPEASLPPPEA